MLISKTVRLLALLGLVTIPGLALGTGAANAQTPTPQIEEILPAVPDTSVFPDSPGGSPTSQSNLVLSMAYGERLLQEAQTAIAADNYTTAAQRLQEARRVFNQLSVLYQSLLNSFNGVDFRIADGLRQQAFQATQMRDEASYQLALVHRTQSQPDLSVPLFVQIIGSQQPTRELGQSAYQQLFELGFVASVYPRPEEEAPAAPDAAPASPDGTVPRPAPPTNMVLRLDYGEQLMQESQAAISAENYTLAAQKLQESRQVFNQLSLLYQNLLNSFNGVDFRVADELRQQAFQATQMRDEATYQLALVHRAQNEPDLSVPLLIQIIGSQQPSRDLGQRAYRQLFELGFVSSPYPRNGEAPTSSVP